MNSALCLSLPSIACSDGTRRIVRGHWRTRRDILASSPAILTLSFSRSAPFIPGPAGRISRHRAWRRRCRAAAKTCRYIHHPHLSLLLNNISSLTENGTKISTQRRRCQGPPLTCAAVLFMYLPAYGDSANCKLRRSLKGMGLRLCLPSPPAL